MLDNAKGLNRKRQERGLDIGEILSAPLVAASSANSMMLRSQTRFLMEYCFDQAEDGSLLPRLIPMKMTRTVTEQDPNSDGVTTRQIEMVINVPLMTLIPINTISVQKVNVDFEMEVTNQTVTEESMQSSSEKSEKGDSPEEKRQRIARESAPKAQLFGKISYDSKENNSRSSKGTSRSQNSSKLKVKIDAGQLPLPLGMTTMLEMYSKSIHPIETKKESK